MSLYTGGLSVLLNLMPTRFFTVAVPPVPGNEDLHRAALGDVEVMTVALKHDHSIVVDVRLQVGGTIG